ncbi:MAG: ATP-binding protein [Pseudomonadota bacterium]
MRGDDHDDETVSRDGGVRGGGDGAAGGDAPLRAREIQQKQGSALRSRHGGAKSSSKSGRSKADSAKARRRFPFPRRGLVYSRLTGSIIVANLIGLLVLLVSSLTITAQREALIEAKKIGVRGQAQIIAELLGQIAIVETDCSPRGVYEGPSPICPLALSNTDINRIFTRVWDSFEGRVRIFDAPDFSGAPPVTDARELLIDDVTLRADTIEAQDLGALGPYDIRARISAAYETASSWASSAWPGGFRQRAAARSLEAELNEAIFTPRDAAERGASSVRLNEDGELVVSVSIPIRRVQAIYGIVTAEIGGVDALVAKSRLSILPFFGLACVVSIISSGFLAARIAEPIRELATAADKVREGVSAGKARIPDFLRRRDEIGELSLSLKTMTQAIVQRIEAIESFAADVAHELKNPLTSIRSATETLTIAKDDAAKAKLLGVIQNDVARMDRLITDISNASRLDAELAREAREPVDLTKLVADIANVYETMQSKDGVTISLQESPPSAFTFGNPSALGQVFRNLIDNARSFSARGGEVRIGLSRTVSPNGAQWRLIVDDDGPGVPEDSKEKIFQRFYTKRPAGASFGDNSGLGLAISRQIVAAHQGRIWVENRGRGDQPEGARFIVDLPAAG